MENTINKNEDVLLKVRDLSVKFELLNGQTVHAVNSISFDVCKGDVLGIVGESGSGKSQTMMAMLDLISKNGRCEGNAYFEGKDMLKLKNKELNKIRGSDISFIFQDPMTSLNPYLKIGDQMTEVLVLKEKMPYKKALEKTIEMLEYVGVKDARVRVNHYPNQLSGGMSQRVMIAMALLSKPKLLIADEPTTALDVTVQKQILSLFKKLNEELGLAIILITHDIGVVASICNKIAVFYLGRVVEQGDIDDVFYKTAHPYSYGLLQSVPRLYGKDEKLYSIKGSVQVQKQAIKGCSFMPRCDYASDICKSYDMKLKVQEKSNHLSACHKNLKEFQSN